ncbi:MAG: TonB-dependent receptor [Proteobacteria bacterium]|nr:TonB-dependent receptor [Pseudomonadota bacterium]
MSASNNNMYQNNLLHIISSLRHAHWGVMIALSLCLGLATPVIAQEEAEALSTAELLLEEVIVTARKREESAQHVPLSVTAYGSQQLEALKIRDLQNLSVAMPNVAMDDIGTFRSTANFSIRGLGINSSIPSIDPTVGVFIDGVYIGQNAGIILDMFDIHSVEILRGPQGTLFGRNVTGGAVLINTKRPTDELEFSARVAIDGNPNGDGGTNTYAMASISGPISDTVGARVSFYRNDDDGWFVNLANGENFGQAETTIFRPVLTFRPSDNVEITLRWEHLESDGQGPASQTHINGTGVPGFFANFDRDSFDFSIDNEGFVDIENDFVTVEINLDVAFGDGRITNIFGWRDYTSNGESDIDAQPVALFHAPFWNYSEQYSNELRYNGNFGQSNVTVGVFWFTNEINYHERRNLIDLSLLGLAPPGFSPLVRQDGGGDYWVDSLAAFLSVDHQINDDWSVNAGIRFTHEKKKVNIASLVRNTSVFPALNQCNVTLRLGPCIFDFSDEETWNAWSGKLGFGYSISDDKRMYAHWSRAQRSGGYNLRNTALDTVNFGPGPFDEETVDNFELGFKSDLSGGGRFNAAVFFTQIDDMQREINLSDPNAGVVQVIKNTADAEILGFEIEGMFGLGDNTVLMASLGWIDADYTAVRFDLNSDGVIDAKDEELNLPRAAKWTYSIGLTHDIEVGDSGYVTARVNYAFRDDSSYTDNNLGFILSQQILDAGLDYRTAGGHWVFSLYGRNLLNEVKHGGDTQLPSTLVLPVVPMGGTFSPLAKGRVAGFEVTFNY